MKPTHRLLLVLGVLAVTLAGSARSDGAVVNRELVEISAPLFPDVLMLYQPFPTTLGGEQALVESATYTYDRLITECAADYPAITPTPLTTDEIAANYATVAQCAYEKHTAKPYWIPKLLVDVDICGTELGAGWRLVGEDDLATLTEGDYQFLHDTLAPFATQESSWGPLYFGLTLWLRAHDGTLAVGNLEPGVGAANRITMRNPGTDNFAYQVPIALRCIRRTDLPTGTAGGSGTAGTTGTGGSTGAAGVGGTSGTTGTGGVAGGAGAGGDGASGGSAAGAGPGGTTGSAGSGIAGLDPNNLIANFEDAAAARDRSLTGASVISSGRRGWRGPSRARCI
jgi:hypothetical protein